MTAVVAFTEKKILKNSKIKHLGERPEDFGEIGVTTWIKRREILVFESAGDFLITLPMR